MDLLMVYIRFLKLCRLSEDDGEKYRFLCDDAIKLLASKAKNGSIVRSHNEDFCIAAAALAAVNYVTLYSSDGIANSFKAGDFTVQLDGDASTKNLKTYYKECMKSITPYLNDTDFVFEAV